MSSTNTNTQLRKPDPNYSHPALDISTCIRYNGEQGTHSTSLYDPTTGKLIWKGSAAFYYDKSSQTWKFVDNSNRYGYLIAYEYDHPCGGY